MQVDDLAARRQRMLNLARAMLPADDAEDAVQDAMISAWRHLGEADPEKLDAWLLAITANMCRNRCRRMRPAVEIDAMESGDRWPWMADPSSDPCALLLAAEKRDVVRRAINRLPKPHRVIIAARYRRGMGVPAIAAKLGIAEGTVKSRLARAREHLMRLLVAYLEA